MIWAPSSTGRGALLSGQTPEAFWNSVAHAAPLSIGLNCALGARQMRAHIAGTRARRRHADLRLSQCRIAQLIWPLRRESADHGGAARRVCRRRLVDIVGGCCGTMPDNIRAIAAAMAGKTPRQIPTIPPHLRLSGLEAFTLTPAIPFVNVGERTNVTGSARFRKYITAAITPPHSRSRATRWKTARKFSTSTWTRACSIRSRP